MKKIKQFKSESLKEEYLGYVKDLYKDWPKESEDRYVETSFGSTFIRILGKGPNLVLLPGTNGGSIMYKDVVRTLSKSFRVIAVDIIGDFGLSLLKKPIVSTDDYINWQEELYSSLDLGDCFSIVGVSMGAWLGALYSSAYKRVKDLILISPVAVVENLSPRAAIYGIIPIIIPGLSRYFIKKYFKDYIKEFCEKKFEKEIFGPIESVRRSFNPVKPVVPGQFTSEEFSRIKARTLYLVGENEILYDYKQGEAFFRENSKDGLLETYPNCGHDLFPIKSSNITDKIIDFCQK